MEVLSLSISPWIGKVEPSVPVTVRSTLFVSPVLQDTSTATVAIRPTNAGKNLERNGLEDAIILISIFGKSWSRMKSLERKLDQLGLRP